jgi:hypothetical protein
MPNWRVVIFAGVMLCLIGWPVCYFLDARFDNRVHYFGTYREVSLRALGDFDLDPNIGTLADVPSKLRELDGQKVLLEGEIYAPQEAGKNTTEFQLEHINSATSATAFCPVRCGNETLFDGPSPACHSGM